MSTPLATNLPSPKYQPGIRLRVALWLTAITLLTIIAQSTILLIQIDRKEEEFIDKLLGDQIEHSMQIWQTSPEAAFPNTPSMWLYRIDGVHDASHVPPFLARLPDGNHETHLGSKEYHVAVRHDDGARYILAYDVEDHEERQTTLILSTVLIAGTLAVIMLVAIHGVAGHLSQQVERLSRRVASDFPGPLIEPRMPYELRTLATAIEDFRSRQSSAAEREKAFAANLAHELRTPLTSIRTTAEMISDHPATPLPVIQRAQRIIDSVDRVNRLSTGLLLLARETTPQHTEPVNLRNTLNALWTTLNVRPEVTLSDTINPEACVIADPALLNLVLGNLLDNAQRHTPAGTILATWDPPRLIIRDAGPGFPEGDPNRLFNRFTIGEGGRHGLGLALARQACDICGWHIEAGNAPGGGAEVQVTLT